MPSRAHRPALLCLLVMASAVASLAQNNPPEPTRGYKRPTLSRGSPARPLTKAARGRPADLSKHYIREHGNEADLTAEDVADVVVTSETKSRHTGITHVYLRQRVDGLEVFGADSNFNVGADGALLSFGTSFLPEVRQAINRTSPEIGAVDAASSAAAHVGLNPSEPLAVVEEKDGVEQETILTGGGIASTPIVAKLVYQPVDPADVRLAWQVDIDEASGQHLWRMTVDAETGEVLNQEDYVVHDNWDLPADEPGAAAPSAAALDLDTITAFSSPALSSPTPVFDGSSYHVFAMPKESPNDGPQTLVENPADATASPFG